MLRRRPEKNSSSYNIFKRCKKCLILYTHIRIWQKMNIIDSFIGFVCRTFLSSRSSHYYNDAWILRNEIHTRMYHMSGFKNRKKGKERKLKRCVLSVSAKRSSSNWLLLCMSLTLPLTSKEHKFNIIYWERFTHVVEAKYLNFLNVFLNKKTLAWTQNGLNRKKMSYSHPPGQVYHIASEKMCCFLAG